MYLRQCIRRKVKTDMIEELNMILLHTKEENFLLTVCRTEHSTRNSFRGGCTYCFQAHTGGGGRVFALGAGGGFV